MSARRAVTVMLALTLSAAGAAALPPPPPMASPLGALLARGDAALAAGDSISAISFYREAVARAPRDPRGYVALGRAYLHVNEPKHALEAFEVGARSTQITEDLVLGVARAQAQLGRPAQALQTLRGALMQPPSTALLEALADSAEAAGAFTEALAVRRALLARAREAAPMELRAYETRVLALELLLGAADRLGRQRCNDPQAGLVLRALLGC